MANLEFAGFLYTDAGVAVNGATVDLLDRNTTTPVRATTTTNASGYWTISHATEGRFDVRITNGSSIRWHKYDAALQLQEIETANLLVRNPANTFKYDIVPSAITADRQLNLPLITATDTLMTLGLAATVTGAKTFDSSALLLFNPAGTFAYTFAGSAITAARAFTLPLLTANDTAAVLALAQTFLTGAKTFNDNILTLRNPADTFSYSIRTSAITAARDLTLPLLTANDTLAVLAEAQTYLTGVKTFRSSILAIRNPADTFSYTLVASAITAARNLTLPLTTADDVLAVLGLAQIFTAVQTFNENIVVDSALVRWTAGLAMVAGDYAVTRDADATNQLHLNVPTGATFEFSVNDVAQAVLGASSLTGNVVGTGASQVAQGNHTHAASSAIIARIGTDFQASGRYTLTLTGTGTNTFGTDGVAQDVAASASDGARLLWSPSIGNLTNLVGSPMWSTFFRVPTLGTDLNTFCGIGTVAATGGAISYTFNHVGFKIIRAASGTANLSATQADGTTETASASLQTVAAGDDFDCIVKVNAATSADYYTRKTTGALSSATNLTGNMPAATATARIGLQISNVAVATASQVVYAGMGYERG